MVIDVESDKVIQRALLRSVTDLEIVYCRNVNFNCDYAQFVACSIASYVKALRKFDPLFVLVTGSSSLGDFLKKEVYDA